MRAEFFNIQYRRLQARFGDKAFDSEFAKLLAKELSDQDDYDMQRVVDNFVGSRRHNQAPLLAEFREEFLRLQKYKPDFKTDQAPDCHVCDGSGCTFHFKFGKYQTVFRCPDDKCEAAYYNNTQNLIKYNPIIHDQDYDGFIPKEVKSDF